MRTETFSTPGSVSLDVRLGSGEIRIETDDVPETRIELEPLRDNEATHEAIQNARVEMRERGDGQEITVDLSRGSRRFGRGPDVGVHVRAPHGVDADVKSGSANVEGRGRFGSVEVETGSGDVEFEDVAEARINAASGDVQISTVRGDARLNTASGDVQLQSVAGDAKINSASGDIIVREVEGEFQANSASGDVLVKSIGKGASVNSASGDQQIGSVGEGSVSLKSASGDLKIGIRQGSRLYVDARSRSGDVTSELEVTGEAATDDGPLVELRANTMSGDISISRA